MWDSRSTNSLVTSRLAGCAFMHRIEKKSCRFLSVLVGRLAVDSSSRYASRCFFPLTVRVSLQVHVWMRACVVRSYAHMCVSVCVCLFAFYECSSASPEHTRNYKSQFGRLLSWSANEPCRVFAIVTNAGTHKRYARICASVSRRSAIVISLYFSHSPSRFPVEWTVAALRVRNLRRCFAFKIRLYYISGFASFSPWFGMQSWASSYHQKHSHRKLNLYTCYT